MHYGVAGQVLCAYRKIFGLIQVNILQFYDIGAATYCPATHHDSFIPGLGLGWFDFFQSLSNQPYNIILVIIKLEFRVNIAGQGNSRTLKYLNIQNDPYVLHSWRREILQ